MRLTMFQICAPIFLLGTLIGCSSQNLYDVLPNAMAPQATPTYEGSGEATEPSIRFFPNGWNGFKYWLVINPYPNSDASKENPSILVSNDGATWQVPPGLTNPIALPTAGHLADGELFYDSVSDQLWVYYIWEDATRSSNILRKTSSDGVNWTVAEDVVKVPNYEVVSPTLAQVGNTYYMWTVNAGSTGCNATTTTVQYRTSPDGATWSEPQASSLSQSGYIIWHIEVIQVPSMKQFWMLSAAYPIGSNCGNTVLFFSRSRDALHWQSFNKAALSTGKIPTAWDHGQIYRSTGFLDPASDLLRLWYSARNGTTWHIGYTQGDYDAFLQQFSP
jgi:hypothetical protein